MPPPHPPLRALALAAASIQPRRSRTPPPHTLPSDPPPPPVAPSPGPGGGEGTRRRGGPVITEPPVPNSPSRVTRSRSRMAARTPSSSHTPVDGPAALRDTDEPPAGESNDSFDDVSDDGESTPTVSGNEQETGLDSEATQDQAPKQKKARKPRRPNQLTNETFVITRVDDRGVPASPVKFSKGYSNAIGCIVRETLKITCTNLRAKEHENLRQRLFNKLFNRYVVPGDDKERVKTKALSMMTKALNTWRTKANAIKEKDFESVIKKKWPQIDEEDWKQFISSHTNDEFKQKSEWGKHMRLQNKFPHKLGSRGYLGKRSKWDKEDAALIAAGKEPPFSCIEPGHGRDFLRARASYDPVTGEPVFKHQKLAEVHDKLKKHSREPQSQSSQDSAESERWEDPLSKALGGTRRRRRARYDSHFEERVSAVAEATLRRILAERDQEQGHPPLHPDTQMLPFHIVGRSSSSSVLDIAPGPPNPIDDITVITPCQLMAPMLSNMVTVAHGRVYPKTAQNRMHYVDLPPDMARVDVTEVLDPFVDLKINDHPELGCSTLGQYKGHVIKWPKVAIKLCGTSTHTSPSLTTARTPPGPSPLGLCAPLSFVDLDGDHGAEHDMHIDQEQGEDRRDKPAPVRREPRRRG